MVATLKGSNEGYDLLVVGKWVAKQRFFIKGSVVVIKDT